MTSSPLYQKIQQFYDDSSGLWEEVWGEHMHHGYYAPGESATKDRRQAQIDLIEELLRWAGVKQAEAILDVGCGIGGSTLYLAAKFAAEATGITLSPVQANRAAQRAQQAGLGDRTLFEVRDALDTGLPEASFDFIWSMESGEHMPDKAKFLQECYRLLKPGGSFVMATWCHRPIDRQPLTADEQKHLDTIYQVYCLPYVISLPEYQAIAASTGFEQIRTADWSQEVAPFWDVVINSAFTPKAIWGVLTAGWPTIQATLLLWLMSDGYRRGLIRFGLLCGTKSHS